MSSMTLLCAKERCKPKLILLPSTGWPSNFGITYWTTLQSSKELGEVTFERSESTLLVLFSLNEILPTEVKHYSSKLAWTPCMLFKKHGCSLTRSLARSTHQLEALNHWHKKSERKKKSCQWPFAFSVSKVTDLLPDVTFNLAKLDNYCCVCSRKKSSLRNLRCCVRYFFKLSFTPILTPQKTVQFFFPFLFNGWMDGKKKDAKKSQKDTSTVYL